MAQTTGQPSTPSTATAVSQSAGGAVESLVTKRVAVMRDAPGDAARALQSLVGQTAVTKLAGRSGPWVQVQHDGTVGWLHMFDLAAASHSSPSSVGTTVSSAATGLLRGVTGLFNRGSGGQGTTVATATVGIRGLGAEDLANAQPNLAAVDQMDAQRTEAVVAQRVGTALGLRTHKLDVLVAASAGGGADVSTNKSTEVAR
jgi:Bacterial SH3 domain